MKLLVFFLASILVGTSSSIPMRGGYIQKPIVAFYLLPKSELASFTAMSNPLGDNLIERGSDPEAVKERQPLNDQSDKSDGEHRTDELQLAHVRIHPRENSDQRNGVSGRGAVW